MQLVHPQVLMGGAIGGCRLGDTNPISLFVSYRGLYGVDQVLMGVAIVGGVD